MRLLRYVSSDGRALLGVRRDGAIVDSGFESIAAMLAADGGTDLVHAAAEEGEPVPEPTLLAPLLPGKILCCGFNFADHRAEDPDALAPEEPFLFAKLPSAVVGPGEAIRIPGPETLTDWEVELALVVGRRAHRVKEAEALDYVFGWTLLNDVSARDVQFRDNQITLGKGPDTFAPLGPEIVTTDELGDWSTVRLSAYVNGDLMQSAAAGEMLFSPARLLAFATALVTLEPGDVVSTGTPAGVGCFRDPPVYLRPGDEVTVSADRIGDLVNPVVAGW